MSLKEQLHRMHPYWQDRFTVHSGPMVGGWEYRDEDGNGIGEVEYELPTHDEWVSVLDRATGKRRWQCEEMVDTLAWHKIEHRDCYMPRRAIDLACEVGDEYRNLSRQYALCGSALLPWDLVNASGDRRFHRALTSLERQATEIVRDAGFDDEARTHDVFDRAIGRWQAKPDRIAYRGKDRRLTAIVVDHYGKPRTYQTNRLHVEHQRTMTDTTPMVDGRLQLSTTIIDLAYVAADGSKRGWIGHKSISVAPSARHIKSITRKTRKASGKPARGGSVQRDIWNVSDRTVRARLAGIDDANRWHAVHSALAGIDACTITLTDGRTIELLADGASVRTPSGLLVTIGSAARRIVADRQTVADVQLAS